MPEGPACARYFLLPHAVLALKENFYSQLSSGIIFDTTAVIQSIQLDYLTIGPQHIPFPYQSLSPLFLPPNP